MEELNNKLHTTQSSSSTQSLSGRVPKQKDVTSIDLDERLPGLENLSGEQLFFLNFAQVA